jgi:hypothetical protein
VNQALSNGHSLDQQPSPAPLQIHPFSRKSDFSAKIYGFFENFFRSKERPKKVTSGSANERTLAALFLKKCGPPLLVFFWGVLDMRCAVALLRKSETSILFDANPILRTVTVHAQISKNFFY